MNSITGNLSHLNDAALLAAVLNTVQDNRVALLQLLRYLGEVDAREGYASLFAFCQGMQFSKSEAYKRDDPIHLTRPPASPSQLC